MKIKEMFRRNLGMKLLALLSAFVLWLYVAYQNPATEQVLPQVPLEYQGLPKDVAVVGIPRAVSIRIQGARALDGDVTYKDVRAYVDLKDARVGNNILNVKVTMPAGSRLVSVSPERVSVQLDVIKEKQVPVQVEFSGAPKAGYTRLSAVLKPDQVLVRGPQEFLEKVEQAVTWPAWVFSPFWDQTTCTLAGKAPADLPFGRFFSSTSTSWVLAGRGRASTCTTTLILFFPDQEMPFCPRRRTSLTTSFLAPPISICSVSR